MSIDRNYDCKIHHWELVTLHIEGSEYLFVRGIILEDFKRDFEPGFWVCSTPVIEQKLEDKIMHTKNTRYLLEGEGGHFETDNQDVILHLRNGLSFKQAQWAIENNATPFSG